MMIKLLSLFLASVSILAVANGHHQVEPKHQASRHNDKVESINLSAELSQILTMEMQQIKGGMESLVFATVSGDWQKIASVGKQIKQSYILKQKLSPQQSHELHQKLPQAFKRLDQQLHQYAGMLAHVADERDIELVNYYIYKMNETCTQCHSRFVQSKFSGFSMANKHHQENPSQDKQHSH
jgi:hypothetical protein